MQKVVDILEQHVQWIAMGLGGLFVLFMVWSYVLTPPAQVEIGGEQYGPGEVDAHTNSTVANELTSAINGGGKISTTVPKYVTVFQETMSWKDANPIELAGPWNAQTQDVKIPPPPGTPGQPGVPQPGVDVVADPNNPQAPVISPGGGKIAALPVLPKPEPAESKFGRSVVMLPVAPGQPAPPPPALGMPGGEDMDWVTQMFKIDMQKLADAFTKARIHTLPPQLATTVFLQVEMERQEQLPDGSWSKPTVVQPMNNWRQNIPPPPFPDANANRQVQGTYLAWATTNTPDILQPAFYVTVPQKGDQWTKPGAQVALPQVFNPLQWIDTRDLSPLTPAEKAQVMKARQERTRLQNETKKQQRPTRPPPGGGPPRGPGVPGEMEGDMMYAPAPPPSAAGAASPQRRAFAPAPARPPARAPYPPPGVYGRPPGMPYAGDEMGMDGEMGFGGGVAVQPGLPQPGVDYPQGEFTPNDPAAQWKGKVIETWAHDVSPNIKAGKTYRYRIRYKIKNPIFAAGNVANDPKLANEFALVSPDSEWSTPVKIPELVNFFVASAKSPNSNTVRFDVFTWDQGQSKKETFPVGPGDLVGGVRNGVNFATDWTVVDFREDPRQNNDWQIMLVNNVDGRIAVRSYKMDSNDALYKGLNEQIKAAEAIAAPTAAAGGVGGPLR